MNRRHTLAAVALAAALTTTLAACSSDTESAASSSPAASISVTGSASDVAFAQSMIPHHQQAVEMADLALDSSSGASPEVTELAQQIRAAQDPEIRQMTTWLQQWGTPMTMPGAESGDIAGMDHGGHEMGGITMSGMMTAEDMQALSESSGQEFDDMWIQMMIAHHEGAVLMAEQVQAQSDNAEVTTMADQIITAQKQEIDTMRNLLAS